MPRKDRGIRDAAGIGPYAQNIESLTPLSSLETWSVAKGEPDVRGWDVRTVSGRPLGTVRDLLVDREAGEVVMVDIDVAGANRHVPVAIRAVQFDHDARVVLMDSADLGLGAQVGDVAVPEPIEDVSRVHADTVQADTLHVETLRADSVAPGSLPPPPVQPPDRDLARPVEVRQADMAVERPVVDGDMARAAPSDAAAARAERRRAERRRIDRMGTDT